MDGHGGRKQRWFNHRYSQNKKGPRGNWKPNVSSWEKEFCKVVGSIEWDRFLMMKRFRHLYADVLTWDDSAGKEAFDNAWRRFWCTKKGYVCDTPLPDPDLYNDIVDWDAKVDPKLWREIECIIPRVVYHAEEEYTTPFGDLIMPNNLVIPQPTGWGDDEEVFDYAGIYTPHDLSGQIIGGWDSPSWPSRGFHGPSGVPPTVGPTFAWQSGGGYPTPGGGWYNETGWGYANNYVGPSGQWNNSHVGTSSARALETSYSGTWRTRAGEEQRNRTPRNDDGWRRPPCNSSRRQSGDGMEKSRIQSK